MVININIVLCLKQNNTKKPQATHVMILLTTQGLGWEVNDAGALEIKWMEGELMPQELVDIIVDTLAGDDEDNEEIPELENVMDLIFAN